MSRLHRFFLIEMPRPRSDAMNAVLAWASQQRQPFTIRQAFDVYKANGGQAGSMSDNIQSFTSQFQGYVAKQEKEGLPPKPGKGPYWPPSARRPMVTVKKGSRGARGGNYDAGLFTWVKEIPPPNSAKFVNPDDDHNTGSAMDRLEKVLSRAGKGLPDDEKLGRQRLTAAINRWKGMKSLDRIVADIRGSIPKMGQMDALHIASEFLVAKGQADEDDIEDAEDQVAPAPEDEDDLGDFGSEDDEDDLGDFARDDDDEEPAPAPAKSSPPPLSPSQMPQKSTSSPAPEPDPEPDEDDLGNFMDADDDDGVEPSTAQQAGAQQVLKPSTPPPAPKSAITRSPVSKFLKGMGKKR